MSDQCQSVYVVDDDAQPMLQQAPKLSRAGYEAARDERSRGARGARKG